MSNATAKKQLMGKTRNDAAAEQGTLWLLSLVEDVLRELNGRDPLSLREWELVAARLGRDVELMPCDWGMDAHVRGGVMYLPLPHHRSIIHKALCDYFAQIAHECAEVAMKWEGRSQINYPPEWGTHHDFAVMIQERFEKRCRERFAG